MSVGFNQQSIILPEGIAGSDYFHNIIIARGGTPYNIIIQGRVPGLTISQVYSTSSFIENNQVVHQILIEGEPKQMGTYSFTITMMDLNDDIYNKRFSIKISLGNIVKYIEDLRESAIYLRKNHSQYEYRNLLHEFYRFQYYYHQITDHNTLDLIESIIVGLQDIIENPYIHIDDALDIMITTLPSTIRLVKDL
jgi:archaellum component FlaC